MRGDYVRRKLLRNGFVLTDVAKALKISPQSLQSILNSADIKTGVLEKIGKAVNKNIYFFFEVSEKNIINEDPKYPIQTNDQKINIENKCVACQNCADRDATIKSLNNYINYLEKTVVDLGGNLNQSHPMINGDIRAS